MIGSAIAHYRITAKLGAGGMGEVYRATDTKLQRDVAIKVLPAAFTEDKERLARFEREAQLLAQLHHPHIASIFAMEKWGQAPISEGTSNASESGEKSAAGPVFALVMELVEGPTLAERLESGAVPLTESLLLARQIAEALEAAHEKGIVHRDLKPQNIKASIEGDVKVLDFGLAKAMDPVGAVSGQPSASQLAQSPTLTLGGTVQGMILGTAAYMSPEQAKGFAVDKRADIWAFGVLLYEMLAGGTLFAGDSVGDTLAAVIRAEIDFDRLPAETPPAIRRLLRRCLERNPKNRLHDVADARIVIDDVVAGRDEAPVPGSAPASPPPRRRSVWILAAMATIAVAVGFVADRLLRMPAAQSDSDIEVAQAIPAGLSLVTEDLTELAISPDGRTEAVTVRTAPGTTEILVRDLSTAAPRLLPGTEGARSPFFSPDGRSIGYMVGEEMRRVPIAGGPSLHVANTVSILATRGASWSRDGYVYFAGNAASGLERVSENGGAVEGVTTLDSARHERTHRWPQALPDGSAVLFTSDTVASSEYYDDARIEAVRPATGERKTLVEGTSMARFLPPDRLVFARGGALFAVRFDPRTLQVRGTPVVVAQGLSTTVSSGAVQFAISETGTLVWVPSQSGTGLKQLVWIDRNGGEEPLDVQAGEYAQLALSPDGRQVAIAESLPPDMSLWILDLARKSLSRLTFQGTVSNPTWTPDSARIAYGMSAAQESTTQIVWQRADGSSAAEPMLEDTPSRPFSFSPDGRLLAFGHFDAHQADATLWLLPVGRASEAHAYPGIEASSFQAEISPDARWIAYSSLDSGAGEVYLRPFPAGDGKWQVSTGVGHEPHWARDGSAIFYRSSSDILRVDADLAHGVHLGMARRVGSSLFGGTVANTFSVAADGRILTLRHPPDVTRTSEVDLATGWGRKVDALLAAKH